MRNAKLWVITVSLLLALTANGIAQKKKPVPVKKTPAKTVPAKTVKTKPKVSGPEEKRDFKADEIKVRDMVTFFEYVLNTLGSSSTSTRDKEVLVTQSYSKIFRDAKVQVEDDLDDEREISTNKDVVAYLKDVDFFFSDVKFEFTIEDIQTGVNASEKTFYKVSLKRNIKGTTSDGKAVNNTTPRFIEVNYDPEAQDLKIASIYTHEINEKEALVYWWKALSLEWQDIFRKKITLQSDSVGYSDIKNITSLTAIDLRNNKVIQSLEPLARLTALKVLDASGTGITDLKPIRNLTELTDVNFSNTTIADLSALRYSDKITRLNVSHTGVSDLEVAGKMLGLQDLNIAFTNVTNIAPISQLTAFQTLNLKGCKISDLAPMAGFTELTNLDLARTTIQELSQLKSMKKLAMLNIDSTNISNIDPLSNLEALKILYANHTLIASLSPLATLPLLEKIYSDHTAVLKTTAEAFTASHPKVLVIHDSEDLKSWWGDLSSVWQEIIGKAAKIGSAPSREELARVPQLDSINVSNNSSIKDLEPLRKLTKLKVIIASKTSITDFNPLQEHREIRYLDVSDTEVSTVAPASHFPKLTVLKADRSKIMTIDALSPLNGLQKLYVDETEIHDITAREFLVKNPKCLLVYKTIHLNRWWRKLDSRWKETLRTQMKGDTTSTREHLHQLAELETLQIKDAGVMDLTALSEFVRLRELEFSGTGITDLTPLATISTLTSLHAMSSPLQNIDVLHQLTGLEDLDISNTPVDDLRALTSLTNLKKFNCSGTQIKRLEHLDKMELLEFLDCSNTKVGNLDPVTYLPLKTLKCYNTKISERAIENFKKSHPDCSVVYYR